MEIRARLFSVAMWPEKGGTLKVRFFDCLRVNVPVELWGDQGVSVYVEEPLDYLTKHIPWMLHGELTHRVLWWQFWRGPILIARSQNAPYTLPEGLELEA